MLGLYRAESEAELDGLLRALPLYEWMTVTVTGLERHPNDPARQARALPLPQPQLSPSTASRHGSANRSISVTPATAGAASCP